MFDELPELCEFAFSLLGVIVVALVIVVAAGLALGLFVRVGL